MCIKTAKRYDECSSQHNRQSSITRRFLAVTSTVGFGRLLKQEAKCRLAKNSHHSNCVNCKVILCYDTLVTSNGHGSVVKTVDYQLDGQLWFPMRPARIIGGVRNGLTCSNTLKKIIILHCQSWNGEVQMLKCTLNMHDDIFTCY